MSTNRNRAGGPRATIGRSLLLWCSILGLVGGGAACNARPGVVASPDAQGARDNRLAIDFQAVGLDGAAFDGNALKGRIVLLDFWAVWCPPCIDAFPKLTELARDLEGEPFELVGVALYSGDHDDVREFLEDHTADYTIVVGENDLAFRYGVIGYPTYLLLDPEGHVHQKYVGALPGLELRVKADVEELKSKYGLE